MDDLTNLQKVKGTFDFLTDIGTLDVLHLRDRDSYVRNVLPLTHAGSLFLLSCWEWSHRWWEQLLLRHVALEPGEAGRRFRGDFEIERIAGETNPRAWGPTYFTGIQKPPGFAVYLMTRKST